MDHRLLQPDRAQAKPIYRQLYERFREAIAGGRLAPGDRVPSVRGLASELNLSRGTVELTYQLLVSEGYLLARGAAGTVVHPQLSPRQITDAVGSQPAIRRSPRPLPEAEELRPLQLGLPALDAFPRRLWARLTNRCLRARGASALAYPHPQGLPALREALARYLGVSRGIPCRAAQIIITAGYPEALSLIRRTLFRGGERGWFEEPGYFVARDILRAIGMSLAPVTVDSEGLHVAEGRRTVPDARFVVVTPSHQSPTGVSMTLPRRLALLEWANETGGWVIEDDYDSEYRYRGRPLPALKSLDSQGRVLYAGTFSKVLYPGLRLAYLVVPESAAPRFRETLTRFRYGCPTEPQSVTAEFMSEGHFARHLKRMRDLYAQRRVYLQRALAEQLGNRLRVDLQAGGMHLLARLLPGEDDSVLEGRAQRCGLGLKGLSSWFIGTPSHAGLLMGFTNVATQDEANRLVGIVKTVLKG